MPATRTLVPGESTTVGGQGLGTRLRQVFHYSDLDSDPRSGYHEAILYMDEQSQEELIRDLEIEDFDQNQFYCKCVWFLIAQPSLYFLIRYFYNHSGGWIWNSDLLALISLFISFRCVPAPTLRPTRDRPLINVPGEWWLKAQTANILASFLLCLWTWIMAYYPEIGRRKMPHDEYICAIPLFMAVLGWLMQNMMVAVNFGELEHLRYNYKGA